MLYPSLRRLVAALKRTPLHPQWFVFLHEGKNLQRIADAFSGRVLDIGCAGQKMRACLEPRCEYVGLDHWATATGWYHTRPHVYADAQALPFSESSMDGVLLLDVMEHLPDPDAALAEIQRVLRPDGRCVVSVPFLYPIHDAPLDFGRWTAYGLRTLAARHGFQTSEQREQGRAVETAALLANIALTRAALDAARRFHPLVILALVLPVVVPCVNLLGWTLARMAPEDCFMPFGYTVTLVRPVTKRLTENCRPV